MEFLVTVTTVGVMLLYSAPGYALVKAKKIQPTSISAFAMVLMYVCQSCLVIYSFQKVTYTPALFKNMLVFFALAVVIQSLLLGTYYLLFRKRYKNVRYRIATIAGTFAVVFSAVYSISMNLLGWTIASAVIANDKKYIKPKNFFFNPSMIALYIALPLFFTHTSIGGNVFGDAVFLLGKMTTPLCMLIMGMRLACVPLKKVVTSRLNYFVLFLKQLVMPVLGLADVMFLAIETNMKMAFYIICCCPIASVVLNYSEMIGEGQETAANLVLFGTFSSIVTIPVMMTLSRFIV